MHLDIQATITLNKPLFSTRFSDMISANIWICSFH